MQESVGAGQAELRLPQPSVWNAQPQVRSLHAHPRLDASVFLGGFRQASHLMLLSAFASLVAGPLLSMSAWYGSCSSEDCSASFTPTASRARLRLRLQRVVLCRRDVTHNYHVHSYICEENLSDNCIALACLQPHAHTCVCCRACMLLLDPRVNADPSPQAQDTSAVEYSIDYLELLMPHPLRVGVHKACCISSSASTSIPRV